MIQGVFTDQIREVAEWAVEIQNILDLSPPAEDFIDRFVDGYGATPLFAQALFAETKKFLMLCASEPTTGFTPSFWVHHMWQHFMLWPVEYRQFCASIGQPAGLRRRVRAESYIVCYEMTRQRLAEVFGECDNGCWNPEEWARVCCQASAAA